MARKSSPSGKPSRDLSPPQIQLPVRFDDRDIDAAIRSLRNPPIPARLKLFPFVLEEWAAVYLPEYARTADISLPNEVRMLEKYSANVAALKAGLFGPDSELLRTHLHLAFGPVLDSSGIHLAYEHVDLKIEDADTTAPELLEALRNYIARIKPGRGRPPNLMSPKVLTDLADIFHWLTCKTPSRAVDPDRAWEHGEFHDFCAALWPAVFRDADQGLPSAIKNWAAYIKKIQSPESQPNPKTKPYRNLSALLANIAMSNPDLNFYER